MTDIEQDIPRPPAMRLDLTPLVDVIFLLLIFFMVSTTFQEDQGIELDLPEATSAAKAEDNELTVRLDDHGVIHFKDQELAVTSLEEVARQALDGAEKKFFTVEADAGANHGSVVAVMDALRKAGAKGLTIATEGAKGGN